MAKPDPTTTSKPVPEPPELEPAPPAKPDPAAAPPPGTVHVSSDLLDYDDDAPPPSSRIVVDLPKARP